MFERFTERSRKVMVLAQEESGRLRHGYIGMEHLLLGLLREGEGVAAQALTATGVTLDGAREQVESIVGYGEKETGGQVPFTQGSKGALEASLKESMGLGHNYIGTEHLLLGLLRGPEDLAARMLSNLGADPEAVRREVVGRLGEASRPQTRGGPGRLERTREVFRRAFGRSSLEGGHPTYERLTERARKIVVLAQGEAHRFNHDYIGTEHLLLGLIREREGVGARVLGELGLDLDEARERVESIVGYVEEATGARAPLTPRCKKVLQLAEREALQLGDDYVSSEHILLGLVRESEGVAARVLSDLDVASEDVRREVVRRIPDREPEADPFDEVEWVQEEEERGRKLFRGRIGGIRTEILYPNQENSGMRVPMVVDLDYAYQVVREGPDGFETLRHDWLWDLVERFLEARELSLPEAVVGLTGDLLLEEVPSIREVTVTATREGPPHNVSVSATFRR